MAEQVMTEEEIELECLGAESELQIGIATGKLDAKTISNLVVWWYKHMKLGHKRLARCLIRVDKDQTAQAMNLLKTELQKMNKETQDATKSV